MSILRKKSQCLIAALGVAVALAGCTTSGTGQAQDQEVGLAENAAVCGELEGRSCEWFFIGTQVHSPNPLAPGWVCDWPPRAGDTKRLVDESGLVPKCVPECCGPKPALPEGYTEDMIRK